MGYPFQAVFAAADTAAVCALQTGTGAGALILNGTQVSYAVPGQTNTAQVVFANVGRPLTYTVSGADLSGVTITATGFDLQGNALSEARAGPNNGTVATTALYHIVTGITRSATIGTAMSVGSASTGVTAWYKVDQFRNPANITVACVIAATTSFSVQDTPDDPETVASPAIFTHPTLVTLTASAESNYAFPPRAIRGAMISSSGAGASTMTIIQAGSI